MIEKKVVELLKESNLTIGSIESLTGGLFASTITRIPGVSKVYKGTVVSYATEIKEEVVNVDKKVVEKYGVISKECALEMAKKGQELLKTNIIVSFTGNAGPSSMEEKEAGLVYIGLLINNDTQIYELKLKGNRNFIRKKCVKFAFNKIFEKINRTF